MKVVIIGGGSAGTSCAFELRKLNKDIKITILESSSHTEYSPCALPYVLSNEITNFEDIFIFSEEDYSSNIIALLLNSVVLDVNRDTKSIVYTNDGQTKEISYDKLILSTGSKAFVPQINGLEYATYHTLKTIDDAKNISTVIKKDSTSLIVGGGLIGMELAISLAQKGERVIILEAQEQIFSSLLDKDLAIILKKIIQTYNIQVYENVTIDTIEKNKVCVKNNTQSHFEFDKLFICTGMRPRTNLAQKIGLNINRGIVVTDSLQTSDSHIYACGDCVESTEYYSKKKMLSQLGTTAVRQAKVIAQNILFNNTKTFPPVLNNTITKIGDVFVASVGLTTKRCKDLGISVVSAKYTGNVRSEYYSSKSTITVKIICLTNGIIIGGQILGDEEVVGRIDLLSLAIQKKCHIEELSNLETCYNPASAPIFDPVTVAASICVQKVQLKGEIK